MKISRLLVVFVLLVAAGPARADDWTDARNQFRSYLRSERWQERAAAYQTLLDYDGAKAFDEALSAALKEENAAVRLAAMKVLAQFESEAARKVLAKELDGARGEKGMLVVMALAEQQGDFGVERLIGMLRAKDAVFAALAANTLGAKRAAAALEPLLESLGHKEWRVASAAARALHDMAWSEWTKPDKKKGEKKKPKMPAWFDVPKVAQALAAALEEAEGALRGDVIAALEKITREDYGDNPAAWRAHLAGEEVTEAIRARQEHPPYFFGVPVHGRRVVIVFDASVLTENVHPFKERKRLQELCRVPGGRDVPWFRLQSIKQFSSAWVDRFIQDMPTRRRYFDLIFSGRKPAPVFGKLQGVNPGSKKKALAALEKLPAENDNDILGTMMAALDIAGSKDSVAWSKGPDVICCVYSSVPWRAEETDAEVVGAAVGLTARRRQVKIIAVGVHEHAYNMMKLFAEQSGGRYVALTQ